MEHNENNDLNNWPKARPEKLIKPGYWPFLFAFGMAFLFWGVITIWIISVAGFLLMVIGLVGWINDWRHE